MRTNRNIKSHFFTSRTYRKEKSHLLKCSS